MRQVCEHGTAELSVEGYNALDEQLQAAAREWMTRQGVEHDRVFQIAHEPHVRYAQIHYHRLTDEGRRYVQCCGCIAQSFLNVDVIADPPPWLETPITETACGWVDKPAGIPGDPRQDRPETRGETR